MLDKKFKKIIDINKYYSSDLSEWAENTENLNDDALLRMLQNLLKEYDMKSELLMQKLKFEREIYKKKRKYREKSVRIGVAHEIRKTKFEIKRRTKLNKKLYRLFKKKIKIDFKNNFADKEKKFNDYCNSQKNEEAITDTTSESGSQEFENNALAEKNTTIGVTAESNLKEVQNDTSIKDASAETEREFDNMAKRSGDDGVGDENLGSSDLRKRQQPNKAEKTEWR